MTQSYTAIPEYRIPIHAPGSEVIHVHTADFIPDSMVGQFRGRAAGYMQVAPARESVVTGLGMKAISPGHPAYRYSKELPPPAPGIVRNAHHHVINMLTSRGIPIAKARSMVTRAGLRVGAKANRGLHRGWFRRRYAGPPVGMVPRPGVPLAMPARKAPSTGMEGATVPEGVLAYANETQETHKSLISKYAAAQTSSARAEIRNEIDALYSGWTDYGMGVKNDVPPFQWNRADPTDAVLLAVRDDIRNTIDLIDAGKAQAALAKQIALLPKPGRLPGMPDIPIKMPDIPWYVWGGAAALAAAVASKAAHLW